MAYIASDCESRGLIMHTEQVPLINYPPGVSRSPLCADKDTFLHFLIVVGGGPLVHRHMNKYVLC